jgi:hypothetical protein
MRDLECVSATFCRSTFEFWGLDILGIPIGNPKFVADSLSDVLAQFDRTLNVLHSRNFGVALAVSLVSLCAQAQIPFRLFADACLPSTTHAIAGSSSPFILRLQGSIRSFLATLAHSSEAAFPDYAWDLATLPIKHGGLGVQDPASFSLLAFISPILRSLQYIHRGFQPSHRSGKRRPPGFYCLRIFDPSLPTGNHCRYHGWSGSGLALRLSLRTFILFCRPLTRLPCLSRNGSSASSAR